jgi:hypothetical protein
MELCGHEECYITLPPTLEFLTENFPLITPNGTLDRSILRCRLCDLITANAREEQAAYPPPTFTNPIPEIRRHIKLTEQLISEDIRKEELEASLPLMMKTLEDEISSTDMRIMEAWMGHWAIWGPGEGPDLENEYVAEEEPELENEDSVEEKPKPVLRIKGRASRKKGKKVY